jgi:hypothetical protein
MIGIEFRKNDRIPDMVQRCIKVLTEGVGFASWLAKDKKAEGWFSVGKGSGPREGTWAVFFALKWSDTPNAKPMVCFYPFPSQEAAADFAIAIADGLKKKGKDLMEIRTIDQGLKEKTTEVQNMLKKKPKK